MLISPSNILKSWGSSLILVLLSILPTGKTLGSFFVVIDPLPRFGLSFSIVANFKILNGRPPIPNRSWTKRISPSPVNLKTTITTINNGSKRTIAKTEKQISNVRTKTTSFRRDTCPCPRTKNPGVFGRKHQQYRTSSRPLLPSGIQYVQQMNPVR